MMMGKKIRSICVIAAVCAALAYGAMLLSVVPVVGEAREAFMGASDAEDCLQRYDTSRYGPDARRKVRLFPLLALHDFRQGLVYVWYSNEVRDGSGALLSGSWDIISKWEIEKRGDGWRVVRITEDL